MLGILLCAVLFCLLPASADDADAFQESCLSFTPEKHVSNSTRQVLAYIPAGTNVTFPDNVASCNRPSQVVATDMCRIALSIPTSNRSSITFEAWFPRNWTGRFLATGNGGVDGCVKYEDLAYASQHGFASIGTNNGHNGTTGLAFYQNQDIVTDFAWRSLHTGVTFGKQLAKLFYGKSHSKSYYIGCSLGGRQGIGSAEKFPDDFDGIVVGAPGVDFNNLYSWRASFFPITGAVGSAHFIESTVWQTLIHDEVLKQCDDIDGVKDGIIEDPSLCHFDPSTLLCNNATANKNCLTSAQVNTVEKVFQPFTYPNGSLIYPAMQPGNEIMAIKLYAGQPWSYSEDWFRYAIYQDPSWNASTFTYRDAAFAEHLNPANIRTFPSDLPEFRQRGGKIIMHHGLQDNQISSFNTPRFYNHLLNGTNSTSEQMDEWIRYFRVSGMFHCGAGPGAWVIGQGGGAAAAGIPWDGKNNVLKAVVDWVEDNVAPTTIEGRKFVNDTVTLGISLVRRHCKYPARNTYIGGNASLPDSWKCE